MTAVSIAPTATSTQTKLPTRKLTISSTEEPTTHKAGETTSDAPTTFLLTEQTTVSESQKRQRPEQLSTTKNEETTKSELQSDTFVDGKLPTTNSTTTKISNTKLTTSSTGEPTTAKPKTATSDAPTAFVLTEQTTISGNQTTREPDQLTRPKNKETIKSELQSDTFVEDCARGTNIDLFFVLDSSTSIWIVDFKKQLEFVKNIVSHFDLNGTRISVTTFSNIVKPEIKLGQYADQSALFDAIDKVEYLTGTTHTGDAIEYMRTEASKSRSENENQVKIAVVITDGRSRQPDKTELESKMAHESGVVVYAVGVGDYIDKNELKLIASDPDDEFVFTVDNYDALDSIKAKFVAKTCEVTKADLKKKDVDIKSILECQSTKSDVTFIIDPFHFTEVQMSRITSFVRAFVTKVSIGQATIRVNVIRDSCGMPNEHYANKDDVTKFVPNVRHSFIASKLGDIKEENKNRSNVAVIFVDNAFHDHMAVVKAASKALNKGVEIYTVAIGNNVVESQLYDVSSLPYDQHIVYVDNIDELILANDAFIDVLCNYSSIKY